MKIVAIFCVVFAVALAEDSCFKDVYEACHPSTGKIVPKIHCNATYGAIEAVLGHLQNYALHHIARSYDYLLMSTHYANFEKNRVGFEKLFRGLSDSTWKDSIELIKYMSKRGGAMEFRKDTFYDVDNENLEMYELESLAKALEIQKKLALDAHKIHGEATRIRKEHHDPEISSYIEKEFVHKHADTVRALSGYTNDLTRFLGTSDRSLALYLFDEYLQKI